MFNAKEVQADEKNATIVVIFFGVTGVVFMAYTIWMHAASVPLIAG